MLESWCVGLRIGVVVVLGLVHTRDYLPFSVDDNQYRLRLLRVIN